MKTPAYSFEPHTGIFNGETEADESPLEPGVFHTPAHSTLIAPPAEIAAGLAAFWRGPGLGWMLEPLPELIDEDLDGEPDAPQGFEVKPAKPGFFKRMAALVKKGKNAK